MDEKDGSVDLTLKLKEKGKNSIGLTGGVSGLAGTFIGLNYSTNNLLGRGESLTVQANIGNLERDLTFGFTEPYLFDRALQAGFTVYGRKYNYNQAREEAIITGQQINVPQALLQNLQNYTQSSKGFTLSVSHPLHHGFKRVGISYTFDVSSLVTLSDASKNLFTFLQYEGISGPNSLNGITTSKVVPSFSLSTVNAAYQPHSGSTFTLAAEIAGLGGTVRSIRPIVEYKHYIPVQKGRNALAFHVATSFLTGYGGDVAPPFERNYMGGENDLRGFDIRSVSPVAYLPNRGSISLQNPDGSPVPKDPNNPLLGSWSIPIPIEQIVFPGGDASVVTNLEYHITIAGPVVLAPFVDLGLDPVVRDSQLRITPQQVSLLNTTLYGCPALDAAFNCVGNKPREIRVNPSAGQGYQLASADVRRPGIGSLAAHRQRSVPRLLGLQSATAEYDQHGTDSHHPRDVSSRRSGRLHLPAGNRDLCARFSAARAAQDLPLHGGNDVLIPLETSRRGHPGSRHSWLRRHDLWLRTFAPECFLTVCLAAAKLENGRLGSEFPPKSNGSILHLGRQAGCDVRATRFAGG